MFDTSHAVDSCLAHQYNSRIPVATCNRIFELLEIIKNFIDFSEDITFKPSYKVIINFIPQFMTCAYCSKVFDIKIFKY